MAAIGLRDGHRWSRSIHWEHQSESTHDDALIKILRNTTKTERAKQRRLERKSLSPRCFYNTNLFRFHHATEKPRHPTLQVRNTRGFCLQVALWFRHQRTVGRRGQPHASDLARRTPSPFDLNWQTGLSFNDFTSAEDLSLTGEETTKKRLARRKVPEDEKNDNTTPEG